MDSKCVSENEFKAIHGIISEHNSLLVQTSSMKTKLLSSHKLSPTTNLRLAHGIVSKQNSLLV
jgi:hypothetical protein